MESLGEKLKAAREAKKISLEQAGKDTKISIRYLKGLEDEDFSGFPGEAYVNGFLRNYGTFLDLNVQELLSLYRSLKLQEQPVPVEQLLKKTSSPTKIAFVFILCIIAAGVIGGGVYIILSQQNNTEAAVDVPRQPLKHEMKGDTFDRRFYIDDSIEIFSETKSIVLTLIGIDDYIILNTPNGEKKFDAINGTDISMDDNGLYININAFPFEKNSPGNGVLLHIEKKLAVIDSEPDNFFDEDAAVTQGQFIAPEIFPSSSTPYPFTLQSAFQNYCMFRWEILMERDRRERKEQFFQRSEEINIQAQNGIRLWVSNAQAVKFQVIGAGRSVPVEIGGAGEVVVCEIKWVRGADSRWRLVAARMET